MTSHSNSIWKIKETMTLQNRDEVLSYQESIKVEKLVEENTSEIAYLRKYYFDKFECQK